LFLQLFLHLYRSFIDQIYVYALVEYQVWSRKIAAVGN
jgi:hypothetical protein